MAAEIPFLKEGSEVLGKIVSYCHRPVNRALESTAERDVEEVERGRRELFLQHHRAPHFNGVFQHTHEHTLILKDTS